jgi:hypothetical protein
MLDINWVLITAIVFIVLAIILFVIIFLVPSGTIEYVVIGLTVLFFVLGIGLLIYYFAFMTNPILNPPPGPTATQPPGPTAPSGTTGSPGPTGPTGPTGPPPDNSVRSGDIIQLLNINQNQFACPCGNIPDGCTGGILSLRTDGSFNQLNGTTIGLRNFKITLLTDNNGNAGLSGEAIFYGETVQLTSATIPNINGSNPSCPSCNGLYMGMCSISLDPTPFAVHINNINDATSQWILADPLNSGSTDALTYNSLSNSSLGNSQPATLLNSSLQRYVTVCTGVGCIDASGTNCGNLMLGTGIPTDPNINWNFKFVSRPG